jgi:hypothetical protein
MEHLINLFCLRWDRSYSGATLQTPCPGWRQLRLTDLPQPAFPAAMAPGLDKPPIDGAIDRCGGLAHDIAGLAES